MSVIQDIKFKCFKKVDIRESNISGQGLFACEPICQGDIVMSFGGVLARIEDRYSGKYIPSTFACVSDNIMICECSESEKDLSDYINHSCSPNMGMYDSLTLIAIRDINKDEELTCDYSFWEADENWRLKHDCNCGSANCRKVVTGIDWMNIRSTQDVFAYYAPFIQRRILSKEKKEGSSFSQKCFDN